MDSTTVSRQNYTAKKRNKENVQPAQEMKFSIKQVGSKTPASLLQPKGTQKETGKVVSVKHSERKQRVGEQTKTILKKSQTDKNQTHQDLKTEQAAKLKNNVGEAPQPPTALQPSKPALGMYKGKIVESKIGSIWKASVPVKRGASNSTVPKAATQKVRNFTTNASTSAVGRGAQPSPILNRSVKPNVNSHPPNGFSSVRPPTRSVPTTVCPRNATVAQSRRCETLNAKPKVPVTDKKASKPPVTSIISQYRTNCETAEEKRAKLAQWLASKGKIVKRPAMVCTAPSTKTIVSNKPAAPPKSQTAAKSNPEPPLTRSKLASATPAHTTDKEVIKTTKTRTSLIMNTTLDLLENSDLDIPVEPQDSGKVDDIVINLCDALEALEIPSQSNNYLPQLKDECGDLNSEMKSECKQGDIKNKTSGEKVKSEGYVSDVQEVDESEESDDCSNKEKTPQMKGASVVKYSVTTTPFLRSVKPTIEDEVCTSASKKKINIKDLKFLTPVRRSSRIHRHSSHLPPMLVDHDPCVSSLAELVKLDDDANVYIYRKNPALVEDLPDQSKL